MSFHAQGDSLQVLISGGDEAHAVLFSPYCRVSTRKVGAKNHFSGLDEDMKKGRAPLLGLGILGWAGAIAGAAGRPDGR
jgi:hypothetical protein